MKSFFFWLVHHFDCIDWVLCSNSERLQILDWRIYMFSTFFSNANKTQIYLFPSQHVYINKRMKDFLLLCQTLRKIMKIMLELESVTAVICLCFSYCYFSKVKKKFFYLRLRSRNLRWFCVFDDKKEHQKHCYKPIIYFFLSKKKDMNSYEKRKIQKKPDIYGFLSLTNNNIQHKKKNLRLITSRLLSE